MSSPFALPTTSSRLLAMAVALVGEAEKVRKHMNFTEADVLAVSGGARELTWAELDLLTTLLVHEQGTMLAQNRDLKELVRLRATPRR
jgi:hypothetical protein